MERRSESISSRPKYSTAATMKPELRERLASFAQGASVPKIGATPVTYVTEPFSYRRNLLKLHLLHELHVENDKAPKGAERDEIAHVTLPHYPIGADKGAAPDREREPYLDAWVRLQLERPMAVSNDEWRLAVTDAGLFLDRWGSLAVGFGWSPDDLFGAPSADSDRSRPPKRDDRARRNGMMPPTKTR